MRRFAWSLILARMSLRLRVVLAVLGLVAVVAAAPFALAYVQKYLRVSLDSGDNPLDYVTIVHRQQPPSTAPAAWAPRLDKQAGVDTGVVVRHDWGGKPSDGRYASDAAYRARLGRQVTLPEAPDYRVLGVLSNLTDPAAVKRFGSFYAIWFQTPVDTEKWLMADPEIFTDAAAEGDRRTWWAGFYAVYYAPPADGMDHGDQVDAWVRSITACPNGERGCTVPEHLKTAGVTPTS